MVTYKEFPNRQEWLKGRENTIGASEVASAIGLKSFCTPKKLWKIKTGIEAAKDLSTNDRVIYGTEAEFFLRGLFSLKHRKEYRMDYHQFRIYINDQFPYMSCTLDGELTRLSDGKKGVWECKTVEVTSSKIAGEWNNRIPDNYFAQVMSQLAITEFDFAVLCAELMYLDGTSTICEYYFDSTEYEEDKNYVVCECEKFWKYVEDKKEPETIIEL